MAINFPASPELNEQWTQAGVTWQWDGEKWVSQSPGGGGGGMPTGGGSPPEDAFYLNTTTIDQDYSVTAGKNAGTFGPVTVNSTVTVPDGSVWTVVGSADGGGGGGGSGVTKIIAGNNVTINPATGTGEVTINASGGSSSGGAFVGQVVAWPSTTVPAGWLECNGSAIDPKYTDLIALIGANTPDLRGQFVRGWDNGRGVDADRVLLSDQLDQMQRITGVISARSNGGLKASGTAGAFTVVGSGTQAKESSVTAGAPQLKFDSGTSPDARVSDTTDGETRPVNVALMYIICADPAEEPTPPQPLTIVSQDIHGTIKASAHCLWDELGASGSPAMTGVYGSLGIQSVEKHTASSAKITFTPGLFDDDNYNVTAICKTGGTAPNTGFIVYEYQERNKDYFILNMSTAELNIPGIAFDFQISDNKPVAITSGTGTVTTTNLYGTAKAWSDTERDGTQSNHLGITCAKGPTGTFVYTFDTPRADDNYIISATVGWTANATTGVLYDTAQTKEGFTIYTGYPSASASWTVYDYAHTVVIHDNKPAEVALTTSGDVINYSGASAWAKVAKTTINGPCALEGSQNIASVTRDPGKGKYKVVFATQFPNANYAVVLSTEVDGAGGQSAGRSISSENVTATGFDIRLQSSTSNDYLDNPFSFAVFASSTITPTFTWTRDGTTLKPANSGDNIEVSAPDDAWAGASGAETLFELKRGADTIFNIRTSTSTMPVYTGNAVIEQGNFSNGDKQTTSAGIWSFYQIQQRLQGSNAAPQNVPGLTLMHGEIVKWDVKYDGSSAFSNIRLNLEPENSAHYISTTNAETGETLQVYSGPTLDVRQVLLDLQSKVEALQAKIQTLEGGSY